MHSELTNMRRILLSSTLLATVAWSGCASETIDDTAGLATGPDEAVESLAQEVIIPNPNGVYFANVMANGTGCPRGTWDVDVDPGGETFTLTFSAYEAILSPGELIKVKDCQIGVKLHSPQGLSYSIGNFYYSGYVFLDKPGMVATQTAGYYFQGNPVDNVSALTELPGPVDDAYIFQDTIGLPDLVWSACGNDRLLNIPTRIIAKNNPAKTGTGYMNTLAVDGSVRLSFRIYWKTCP